MERPGTCQVYHLLKPGLSGQTMPVAIGELRTSEIQTDFANGFSWLKKAI